jgi:hypothetical protein
MASVKFVRGRAPLLALLGLAALLPAGCGWGKGDVTGTVTFNGEPIPWGRITFLSQVGKKEARSARIINGRYTLKGCPGGPARIGVESFKAPKAPPGAGGFMFERQKEMDPDSIPPPELVGKYLEIPLHYADPSTSELEYTVRRGSQEHDITLGPASAPPSGP